MFARVSVEIRFRINIRDYLEMISSNLEIVEAASKLKMFSTLKNWQDRIKEKEPQKVILLVKKRETKTKTR